jgi:DNA-directed RNA polymerase subunit beta'
MDVVSDEIIVRENEVITEESAQRIEALGYEKIRVRSPLTCEAGLGVCSKCYGMDLSRSVLGERGLAVGIIAAQSIGEPGTQLTMRTFHIGGTASRAVEESEVRAKRAGKAKFSNVKSVVNRDGQTVVLNRTAEIILQDERGRELDRYGAPMGSVLIIRDEDAVKAKEPLARWDPHHVPILAEFHGRVRFEDLIEGKTIKIERDARRGGERMQIIEHKGDLHPQLILEDDKGQALALYPIPERAFIEVEDGQSIKAGDLLAKSAREIQGTQDITGGLPRVTELFEARRPKDPSVISEIDGFVELGEKKRGKRTIIVRALGPKSEVIEEQEHAVPQGKHLRVHKGDEVRAGDPLVDGPLVPHDILRIRGEESVQEYLLREIQNVYRSQGVTIDDKHIEIILSQMMRKVQVSDPGDSDFLPGAVVDKFRFRRENERLRKERKKPATGSTLLLGITKASLSSESFISAASFQETTKVLTEAAIAGRKDYLVGLKENVILGHMVPTGTGFRDHYRTRVKKNIDFGEIGKGSTLSAVAFDAQMEKLLSGEIGALSADLESALPLAPTGTGDLLDIEDVSPAEARRRSSTVEPEEKEDEAGVASPAAGDDDALEGGAAEPSLAEAEIEADEDVDAGA